MTELNSKHPNYNDELIPENNDIFRPEFKRDTRGRYFMQLPGYGKWMVGNEPGSKIITQGSEDEAGGPAYDPGSIHTGSLNVETTIWIGDSIYMDGGTGCIIIGDIQKLYLSMCKDGIKGVSYPNHVFAFLLQQQPWYWRTGEKADKGDVLIGSIADGEFIYWNDDEGKLYIFGDIVIHGDIVSDNYVYNTSGYKLEYLTGNAYFNDVFIHGGEIDQSLITNLLAGSEPSIQGWSHDMDFTAPDWQTINWTSGTIYLMDGTTYSVDSGSLTMSSDPVHYIYYNGTSTLQTTTNATDSVGSGKLLICVAKRLDQTDPDFDATKAAQFQVFGNEGQGVFIFADNIAANQITANEMTANSIHAREIDAGAITAVHIDSLLLTTQRLEATTGNIAGWEMSTYCLTRTSTAFSGAKRTRIQLCVGVGASSAGHIQASYSENGSFTHPSDPIHLVQMTQGEPGDHYGGIDIPNPRIDIYRAEPQPTATSSKKRMMLNSDGLHFYDANENSVGTITGNDAGGQTNMDIDDISIANNRVRILSTGVVVRRGVAFNADDSSGVFYFQMYVDNTSHAPYGYQNVLSMSTSNYLKIERSDHAFVARFNGNPGGSYALHLAGALRLGLTTGMSRPAGQHGVIYYDDGTYDVTRKGQFYGYDGYTSSWVTLSGSGLPSGSSYDMMRSSGGTNWVSTPDVYWGSSSSYHMWKDPGTGDTHVDIPSGRDYAFKVGGSYRFVVFASSLVWTNGALECYDQLNFSRGGQVATNGSRITINKEARIVGSLYVDYNAIINGSITVYGTTFLPFTVTAPGSNLDGKKVLAN